MKDEKQKKTTKKTTTKKVKVVGKAEYTNNATGEVEVMDVISIEERDFNFHKLWLAHVLESIDIIGNQKVKLAFWIIDHLNKENQLVYTMRQIQKETKISLDTISTTFKALEQSNFLKRKHSGCYVVNPDVIYKGSRSGRMNVLIQYHDVNVKQESDKRNEVEVTDSTVTNATAVEEIPVATEETTTQMGKRTGKAGTPKPDDWLQLKAKILAKEITKKSVYQSLKISSNTLNKWLAEN